MLNFVQDLAAFGLWVLALARLTRLLTADEITDFIRIWAYRVSHGADTKLTYFVRCAWCMSMWLGFATCWVVYLVADWHDWRVYPFHALGASYLVGVMATNLEPDDDAEVEILDD